MLNKHDIIYGIYLQSCSRYILAARILGKKTILHFVGSDAYWYSRERSPWRYIYWRIILHATNLILYVSPHLKQLVGSPGIVLPLPIDVEQFKKQELRNIMPERDILYYCPSGEVNEKIYRLDWALEYASSHPEETITIIGNQSHPAHYQIELPNVQVIPFVLPGEMPTLYRRHRRLVRMTSEDGLPQMLHEAILAGLEVVHNGAIIRESPPERDPAHFCKSFTEALKTINEDWVHVEDA
jgi:hypothetical protein